MVLLGRFRVVIALITVLIGVFVLGLSISDQGKSIFLDQKIEYTQEEEQWVNELDRPIRLGVVPGWPLITFINEDGFLDGLPQSLQIVGMLNLQLE